MYVYVKVHFQKNFISENKVHCVLNRARTLTIASTVQHAAATCQHSMYTLHSPRASEPAVEPTWGVCFCGYVVFYEFLHLQKRSFFGVLCMWLSVTHPHVCTANACVLCVRRRCKCMVLYSAVSSPLDRSKRFTLSSPGRPVHSDTVLGFSWKHSSHAAIAQRLFTHIFTTVYSQVGLLIYTAESTEASWSERKCANFETVTTGIRTRALSIASPAFYQLSYRDLLLCRGIIFVL